MIRIPDSCVPACLSLSACTDPCCFCVCPPPAALCLHLPLLLLCVPPCCPLPPGEYQGLCNKYVVFLIGTGVLWLLIFTTIVLRQRWLDLAKHKPWRIYTWMTSLGMVVFFVAFLVVVQRWMQGGWHGGWEAVGVAVGAGNGAAVAAGWELIAGDWRLVGLGRFGFACLRGLLTLASCLLASDFVACLLTCCLTDLLVVVVVGCR